MRFRGCGGISGYPRILSKMISSQYCAGSVNNDRYDANAVLIRLMEDQMLEMDQENLNVTIFIIAKKGGTHEQRDIDPGTY